MSLPHYHIWYIYFAAKHKHNQSEVHKKQRSLIPWRWNKERIKLSLSIVFPPSRAFQKKRSANLLMSWRRSFNTTYPHTHIYICMKQMRGNYRMFVFRVGVTMSACAGLDPLWWWGVHHPAGSQRRHLLHHQQGEGSTVNHSPPLLLICWLIQIGCS